MGGYGSGHRTGASRRPLVERCFALDVAAIARRPVQPGVEGTVWLQAPLATWGATLHYRVRDDRGVPVVDLGWTAAAPAEPGRVAIVTNGSDMTEGRVYWLCPGRLGRACGRRVAKLYAPLPGTSGFACRRCHNLAYRSQNPPPSLGALRRRILGEPAVTPGVDRHGASRERLPRSR